MEFNLQAYTTDKLKELLKTKQACKKHSPTQLLVIEALTAEIERREVK